MVSNVSCSATATPACTSAGSSSALRLRRSCWPSSISRKITMSRAVSKPNTTDEGGCSDERVHGVDIAFPLHETACPRAGRARRLSWRRRFRSAQNRHNFDLVGRGCSGRSRVPATVKGRGRTTCAGVSESWASRCARCRPCHNDGKRSLRSTGCVQKQHLPCTNVHRFSLRPDEAARLHHALHRLDLDAVRKCVGDASRERESQELPLNTISMRVWRVIAGQALLSLSLWLHNEQEQ